MNVNSPAIQLRSPSKVHNELVIELKNRNCKWDAPLDFPVIQPILANRSQETLGSTYTTNILQYTQTKFRGLKFYFSKEKYASSDGFSPSGDYPKLLQDLQLAARESGFEIALNGKPRKEASNQRRIVCLRGIGYKGYKLKNPINENVYRKTSLKNDPAQNSRGANGKRLPRRTSTAHYTTNNLLRCKMNFLVSFDEVGFFLVGGLGHTCHDGHPKLSEDNLPTRTKFIRIEDAEVLCNIKEAKAQYSVGSNVFFVRTG